MKRATALVLFLIAATHGEGQMFPLPQTPAQTDWIDTMNQDFTVNPPPAARVSPGAVSVARLRHTLSAKALAAFSRAVKFAAAGAWQKSVDPFKQALAADPDFSEAHGNLGAAYSALHRYDEASAEFRRAIQLDPGSGVHHSNLAYVLIVQGQQKEAELEAKTAVSLSPTDAIAHFLLGFLQSLNPEECGGAERHLAYAARQLPDAHLMLAQFYFSHGSAQQGAAEMERYQEAVAK